MSCTNPAIVSMVLPEELVGVSDVARPLCSVCGFALLRELPNRDVLFLDRTDPCAGLPENIEAYRAFQAMER